MHSPTELKVDFVQTIADASKPAVPGVGINFLKWCGEWDLQNLSEGT